MTRPSPDATLEYDGLGRRIEKKVENSADWEATYYYYYYDDQRMVDVRRDFGRETGYRVVKSRFIRRARSISTE